MKEDSIKNVKLQDIFDMQFLQDFQDSFARAVGVAAITVDKEGNAVTKPTNFTDFCMKCNRGNAVGNKRCIACDKQGGEQAARTGKPAVYECHAGLMDFGAPIILKGQQIGSIIGGQVLTDELNEEKFRKYASELGVNPDEYVAAVKKVRHVSKETLEAAAHVFYIVAKNVSKMGYDQYRLHQLKQMSETVSTNVQKVSNAMQKLANSAHNVDDNQQQLDAEITKVADIAGKITEFTNMIQNIAKQTRMLGLNASIEAARAGSVGAGFTVVAEEIGKLANSSSETVENIQSFMTEINNSVTETVNRSQITAEIVDEQTKSINETANSLKDMSEVSSYLYKLTHEQNN